jgi:hypothetical protein
VTFTYLLVYQKTFIPSRAFLANVDVSRGLHDGISHFRKSARAHVRAVYQVFRLGVVNILLRCGLWGGLVYEIQSPPIYTKLNQSSNYDDTILESSRNVNKTALFWSPSDDELTYLSLQLKAH